MLLKMLCRYTIKKNAQGYWQILFPIGTQISYAALLEISRKMNFAITATCHNSYTYIIFMIALQLQWFFYPN